ncbi:hypothetical protein G1H11_09890 [Phytoactinopolyspora alkaliphila]|uniref:Uncharacterized protein n=1 Tax=Phytoactinopolyspora alkaliphila TaxID=1783498 RepID=A0A6N9YKV4_9ACTN|nr:hypothetical protein [Phytoactinopolyspora alkaliphila]NED95623.1 hypothetical protein [Phytoactinopolyspora alkaliphila]
MTTSTPSPRPALTRHGDGSVIPAAPHLSSLAVDAAAVVKSAKKARKRAKNKPADDTVNLTVVLSKRDRKRLRRRAEDYGWTAEEAAAHVLRAWADD